MHRFSIIMPNAISIYNRIDLHVAVWIEKVINIMLLERIPAAVADLYFDACVTFITYISSISCNIEFLSHCIWLIGTFYVTIRKSDFLCVAHTGSIKTVSMWAQKKQSRITVRLFLMKKKTTETKKRNNCGYVTDQGSLLARNGVSSPNVYMYIRMWVVSMRKRLFDNCGVYVFPFYLPAGQCLFTFFIRYTVTHAHHAGVVVGRGFGLFSLPRQWRQSHTENRNKQTKRKLQVSASAT